MRLPLERTKDRHGFTLIELLVVMGIIAILVALISAAVIKVLVKGPELRTRNDIEQLSLALEQFKVKFANYPPSRIILCEQKRDYYKDGDPTKGFATVLHAESLQFLERCWPRINWDSPNLGPPSWAGIDWNGDGKYTLPQLLEGDQCLVFFLGGIPTSNPPGALGFSTNPSNPAQVAGDHVRFFEFASDRLVLFKVDRKFFSYLDQYGKSNGNGVLQRGMPYAYFSSYNKENGYNRYWSATPLTANVSDCSTLGVWPYAEGLQPGGSFPKLRYLDPNKFQIISAGADRQFGPGTRPTGGFWTLATADQTPPPGDDDMSNFYARKLGD